MNTGYALFEITLTNAGPNSWWHLPLCIIVLACYLGVAYITHATQGFYSASPLSFSASRQRCLCGAGTPYAARVAWIINELTPASLPPNSLLVLGPKEGAREAGRVHRRHRRSGSPRVPSRPCPHLGPHAAVRTAVPYAWRCKHQRGTGCDRGRLGGGRATGFGCRTSRMRSDAPSGPVKTGV